MCAVDATQLVVVESQVDLTILDEGSSGLSSVAEDEEISDIEPLVTKSSSNKVKIMCSYGGRILPRPVDNQLRYVGGETRILVVKKGIKFRDLMEKLSQFVGRNVIFKYQLPNEDLDALISVTSDDDVFNMMDEHDKTKERSSEGGGVKLRAFLFSSGKNHGEESHLKKSPSFGTIGVHGATIGGRAKLPRNHSGERKVMASPVMASPTVPQHGFGSLKAYQEHQLHQRESFNCDCSKCIGGQRRNYFPDGGHLDHSQLLHHNHSHQDNLTCKICYLQSFERLVPSGQRMMGLRHHHHYHHSVNNYRKVFQAPEFSSGLPVKCSYPYYHHQHDHSQHNICEGIHLN